MSLAGKTLFVTGASRGIGLAIALRAARDGANVAIAAKTAEPHPKLEGTIYTAAEEIERAGGKALPLVVDVRDEASVQAAVEQTVQRFGGLDICVNNASAIQLTGTLQTDMKRYDLMHQINARGTYVTSRACIPHLKRSANPHVLMLSPPLDMSPRWFGTHVAYTMAKFGMSMCVLGMAEEFRADGIAFNAVWPRTGIATAAIKNALAGEEGMRRCRTPEIMADAAYAIFNKDSRSFTGQFLIDDSFLHAEGERDFDKYRVDPREPLMPDFFVPESDPPPPGVSLAPVGAA
ncbi:NAD(P)-dependent oxidoreductase [Phenylobacterium sp.]|jgi:citronellol/citronellal dehydrogenase|uniref:SDR family oxidoreductase n=1 Tax=Phenylobacterium sp. TaxID=1871053 RepID=UPI002F91CFC1